MGSIPSGGIQAVFTPVVIIPFKKSTLVEFIFVYVLKMDFGHRGVEIQIRYFFFVIRHILLLPEEKGQM